MAFTRRVLGRGIRSIRGTGRPPARGTERDRFARYRDLAGPRLVGGPRLVRAARLDDAGRLVVLMPHLAVERMSGGPNTILQVTARVAREGIPVTYVAAFGPLEADERRLREHIRVVTGVDADPASIDFIDASGEGAAVDIGRRDVLFATWWPTAHVAAAGLGLSRADAFIYLVQDYEPGFYPWSTEFALAEATYAMPVRAIVNEPTLLGHLRSVPGGLPAATPTIAFTPAVDRDIFVPRARRTRRARRLAFYARPRNPRNLFDLGLLALRTAVARGVFETGHWEFAAIGQEVPDLALSARHTLRAVPWLDYRAYGAFLAETDLLLSLMLSPHTSYPPLEMAATGGRVVTNTFGAKTAEALREISPAIRGVPPDVDALVAAMAEAVRSIETAADTPEGGIAASVPGSWDESLRHVVPWLVTAVRELRAER